MADEKQTFFRRNWPTLLGLAITLLIAGIFMSGSIKPPTDYKEPPRASLR